MGHQKCHNNACPATVQQIKDMLTISHNGILPHQWHIASVYSQNVTVHFSIRKRVGAMLITPKQFPNRL
ncbi:hypothetical protein ABEB36_000948 [Hypothenemus hampei]|uniref:Uncharacterized protein n=1 Tax=Hypothenemus hampei TaxID=57062 RepID=A0ABD1FGJ0_HYPHA